MWIPKMIHPPKTISQNPTNQILEYLHNGGTNMLQSGEKKQKTCFYKLHHPLSKNYK